MKKMPSKNAHNWAKSFISVLPNSNFQFHVRLLGVMTKTSAPSDKNLPLPLIVYILDSTTYLGILSRPLLFYKAMSDFASVLCLCIMLHNISVKAELLQVGIFS